MLLMCQNTTMRVYGALIKRYWVLCSKTHDSSNSLVITSRWFATSRLGASASLRVVIGVTQMVLFCCSHHTALWCMMTSSDCNIFYITGPLWGESTGHHWIPITEASDSELRCFLWSAPEKWLSKQSSRYWFEVPSRSLWCHCNGWPNDSECKGIIRHGTLFLV